MPIKDVLDNLENNKVADANKEIKSILYDKAKEQIDLKRIAVGTSIFNDEVIASEEGSD